MAVEGNRHENGNQTLVQPLHFKPIIDRLMSGVSSVWFFLLGPAGVLRDLYQKASNSWPKPVRAPSSFTFNDDITEAMAQLKTFTTSQNGYDTSNVVHERALLHYWELCCPGVDLDARKTKQWKTIGFQGTDPASDIRGAGILGLQNLLHLASTYPEKFRSMLQHEQLQEGQESYPFSIAGLNMTMLVMQCLGWGFKPISVTALAHRNLVHILFSSSMGNLDRDVEATTFWDDPAPSSLPDLITFPSSGSPTLCQSAEEGRESLRLPGGPATAPKSLLAESGISTSTQHAFNEVFSMCFMELEEEWYSRPAVSYMDFPEVVSATAARVQILLECFTDMEQIEESNGSYERRAQGSIV